MKREASLVPLLHVQDVEADVIWSRDGSVTLVYELEAYHEPGMTDDECNQRAFQAEHAWNGVPEGSTYEFLVVADADRGRKAVQELWPAIPVTDERTRILETYRAARLAEILREDQAGGAGNLVLDRRHFFAATFKPKVLRPTWSEAPVQKLRDVLGFVPRPCIRGSLESTYHEVLAETAAFNRRMENALWQMGLSFKRCGTEEILSLLYRLLNPRSSRFTDLRSLPERPLLDRAPVPARVVKDVPYAADSSPLRALVDDDVEVRWDHLRVADQYLGVVSLKELPDRVEPGVLSPLVALGRRRYVLSFRIEKPSQALELARLRAKGRLASGLTFQNFIVETTRKDAHADAIGRQTEQGIERAIAAAQKFFGLTLQIVLYEPDRDRLDEACAEVIGMMAGARGLRGYREAPALLEAYLSVIPGCPHVNSQRRAMTPVMVDLLPIYDCRPSTGAVPFRTSRNTVVWLDPFDTSVNPNANVLVTGTSGAGKSVAVQMIVSGYEIACAARGLPAPCVYIVDCGGSYDRYLRVRPDGLSRAFTPEDPACVDPFAWSPEDAPLEDQISRLTWLLVDILQVNDSDRERFARMQAVVERAVTHMYAMADLPQSFKGFDTALAALGGDDAALLRRSLWPFMEGRLARLIEPRRGTTMTDAVRAVGYDFKGLAGKPDEAALALRLVIFEIRRRTARLHRQHVRSLVVFDESWMLLSSDSAQRGVVEAAGPFIGEYVRTARKDGGGVIGLSQNISDFQRCPWGAAIIGNSGTKLLGAPGSEGEARDLQQNLGLSDRQYRQLLGVRRTDRWHEFLMIQGGGGATGRSEVVQVSADQLSLWTFGTSPHERRRMREVADANPALSLFEQIELLAAES